MGTIADKLLYLDDTKRMLREAINAAFGAGLTENTPFREYANVEGLWNPRLLFLSGEQGAWYDPSDLSTLFQDAGGTTPVTTDGDPVGLMLDKSRGLELGLEVLVNGDFSSGTAGWTVGGSAVVDGALVVTDLFNNPVRQEQITASGRSYVVNFEIIEKSSTTLTARLRVGGGVFSRSFVPDPGNYSFVLRSGGGDIAFELLNAAGSPAFTIDNVSVRELPGNHATQSASAARPVNSDTPPLQVYDNVDDAMNVTLPAIAAATVAIATPTGADIQYPVDLSSGSYTITESHSGIIIREGELTAAEQQQVTDYLNAQAGV